MNGKTFWCLLVALREVFTESLTGDVNKLLVTKNGLHEKEMLCLAVLFSMKNARHIPSQLYI